MTVLGAVVLCILVWCAVADDDCAGGDCFSLGEAAASPSSRMLFDPEDQFTLEQRRHGAVLLHCIGLLYMFAAIAIVCDECFVPALEVITEVLNISPDVAGATFMAAGGSAPEFFTSLIGSLVTESDVGTGTIIGSAVFNVLFVIGACAIVAPEALQLTWYPLARDSCFYTVDLIVVTVVFLDEKVMWYEAAILFLLYLCYIVYMRFSYRVEAWALNRPLEQVKEEDDKNWAMSREKMEVGHLEADVGATAGTGDTPEDAHVETEMKKSKETPTPIPSAKSFLRSNSSVSGATNNSDKKVFKHHSMRVTTQQTNLVKHIDPGSTGGSGDVVMQPDETVPGVAVPEPVPEEVNEPTGSVASASLTGIVPMPSDVPPVSSSKTPKLNHTQADLDREDSQREEEPATADDEEDKPLSFFPPEGGSAKEWIYYVLTLPIVFVLVMTIPDVRRDGWRKLYPVTFVMSILWIAFFTWAMVWFCGVIGKTAGISDSILGMTVIAAGTSVPDMLTSMIVARQGHGDMAVSSSIGSNIFDVTVGLPIPWLLFSMMRGRHVTLDNTGLEISVMILLAMLALTIGTIMFHGWVMTKWMGGSMMFLYLVFQGVSVGLFVYSENGGSLKLINV